MKLGKPWSVPGNLHKLMGQMDSKEEVYSSLLLLANQNLLRAYREHGVEIIVSSKVMNANKNKTTVKLNSSISQSKAGTVSFVLVALTPARFLLHRKSSESTCQCLLNALNSIE